MTGSFDLIDKNGHRKYLVEEERHKLMIACKQVDPLDALFCQMLLWTGARISEVLCMTSNSIDLHDNLAIVRCLKKRRQNPVYRRIPLPEPYLIALSQHFGLYDCESTSSTKLWRWSRATASRHLDNLMELAGISGPYANSRGLRHSFALICAQNAIPASVIKKWMGHSSIKTTMIYMDFGLNEQRNFAQRIWN